MKMTMDKNTFLLALNTVAKAIHSKPSLEVLKGVQIRATQEVVTLMACNLSMAVTYKIPVSILDTDAQVEMPGEIIVEAKHLLAIMKKYPKCKIFFERVGENLVISGGKTPTKSGKGGKATATPTSQVEMNEIDGEMPAFEAFEPKLSVYCNSSALYNALRVGFAASTEEVRPALKGIQMELGPKGLNTVATDSHRLALSSLSDLEGERPEQSMVLLPPAADVDVAVDVLPPDEDVLVQAGDSVLSFFTDFVTVYLRQIDAQYPDLSRVLPNKAKDTCRISVNRKELLEALDRALVMAPSSDKRVHLVYENQEIQLTAKCDLGSMSEAVPATGEGQIEIYFNAKYVIECLASLRNESVTIRFQGKAVPFVVEGDIDTHVILPLRVFE